MLLYCHRMLAVPGSRVLKEAALFRGASIEQAFPGRSQKGQLIPGAYRSRESHLVCAPAPKATEMLPAAMSCTG